MSALRLPCLRFVLATTVVAVGLAVAPLPLHGVLADAVQDTLHAAGFALFTLLLVRCATTRGVTDDAQRRRRFAAAVGIVLALAIVTEGAQYFTPRDSNPDDFERDILGVGVGIAAALALATADPRRRRALLGVIAAGVVVTLVPLATVVHATVERARSLPVLHDFEHAWERRFITARSADVKLVPTDDPDHATVLRATYRDRNRWPAVIFHEVPGDWSGYDALVLEIENAQETPIRIGLRIDDETPDPVYEDRFQHGFGLEPGWQTIRVPLDDVVAGVSGHAFDVSRVRSIALFALSSTPRPFTVRIDGMRLESAPARNGP